MKKRAEKRATRMVSLAVAIIVMLTSVNMEALAVNRVARSFLTVIFESNGGSAVESKSVMIGNYVEKPEDPTREGYLFDGWFEDEELTDEWDFENDSVDYDKVIPKWTESSCMRNGLRRKSRISPLTRRRRRLHPRPLQITGREPLQE